jgi:hypothetical protein
MHDKGIDMNNLYWIYDWAGFRRDEIVRVPHEYAVHRDFSQLAGEDAVRETFLQLNNLYDRIYGDIAEKPEEFGMPLHVKNKYRHFSQQWRDSGQAPYRPFILLYNLLICGEIHESAVKVPIDAYMNFKYPPKQLSGYDRNVSKPHILFDKLTCYGFVFEGLKNFKTAGKDIFIHYTGNKSMMRLFKALADKANNVNRPGDFLCCSFRLLQDDMHTAGYGCLEDLVDKVHTAPEKEFVYKMDGALKSIGLYRAPRGGYEGPGLAYYRSEKAMESKGPYSFRMVARSPDINDVSTNKMLLGLRIRNAVNCLEYLKICPESVRNIFVGRDDKGCGKRLDNSCKHGVEYVYNGVRYRRCGCCHTAFDVKPDVKDIPHYIKLVELGEKK